MKPMPIFFRIVLGIYYAAVAAMFAITIGGFVYYLAERQEAHREAQAQAREYNESVREMERVMKQMQRQRASADLEQRTLAPRNAR